MVAREGEGVEGEQERVEREGEERKADFVVLVLLFRFFLDCC